jgi:hypothetical protein
VHLRHPQATEDDLVESRVGPAGQEAVELVPVTKSAQRFHKYQGIEEAEQE